MPSVSCVVALCTKIGTLTFPADEARRTEWIQAIEHIKPGRTIRKYSRICSDHFKTSDFNTTTLSLLQPDMARKSLKKTAVPSKFPWTIDLDNKPSTSQDQNLCVNANIKYTYSRVPRIMFVEEQLHLNIPENDVLEDPLQLSNEPSVSDIENEIETAEEYCHDKPDEIDVAEELEICTKEEFDAIPVNNVVEKIEKSVQTQDYISHSFSIHHYKDDDRAVHRYTGLENFNKLMLVFNTLGQCAHKLNYFYGLPPQNLDAFENFFITLLIIRRKESLEMIATMYRVSIKQIYNIFITWIRFMSLQWNNLELWVPRENVKEHMPLDFYDKYPSTRVILDAIECPIKKPKLPLAQQVTFSTYKNKNTIKFLIGITPSGLISYVSPCYGGSATDRQIIERSSILTKFDYNDEIMVNKGLNVQDIFTPYGVKVNMPAFFKKGNRIAPETSKTTRKVANKRVQVERVIGLLKSYKILSTPMNHTETMLASDIVFVCAMLVNFRSSNINKYA